MNPKVSVMMACKNSNKELLKASINSVLNQTYKDFEFVIVDDGSGSPMEPVIRGISDDKRIKVLRIEPSGLGAALNYGIAHSDGEYIARIDDDDLMASERLEKQVAFLNSRPDVACVGSQRYSFCGGKYLKHRRYPVKHEEIIKSILSLKWSMAHSALMFRRSCFDKFGGYRIKGAGQDMDLLLQLGLTGKLENIDEFLTYYYLGIVSFATVNKTNRMNAYLFALNDLKENNKYFNYRNLIESSIDKINMELKKRDNGTSWKKWVTVHAVKWFGDKLPKRL